MSNYEVISLKNESLGINIEIIPEFGGRLNKLIFKNSGRVFDLIDESQPDADLNQVNRFNAVPLFPFPNRLDKGEWTFNGSELTFPINEPENQNALHGFLYHSPFEIIENRNDEHSLFIKSQYQYDGSFPYYPFPMEISQTYSSEKPDQLNLEMTFTNSGNQSAPFGFGWHPYFRFGSDIDDLFLKMPVTEEILIDERQLPTGETVPETYFSKGNVIADRSLDTCFRILNSGSSETIIRDLEKTFEFRLLQSQIFRYVQVYTKPHRQTIAIEPVTSNINMLQNHQHEILIQPGETVSGNIQISIKKLS